MNENYDDFIEARKKGVSIKLPVLVFYSWIKEHYKNKKTKYIMTKYKEQYIIFPLERLEDYFKVEATYRIKKSGSSSLNKKSKEEFEYNLKKLGIVYEENNGNYNFLDSSIEDKQKFSFGNNHYMLRDSNEGYKVRKLSNTANANVIFSLELRKNIKEENIKKDLLKFEKDIRR